MKTTKWVGLIALFVCTSTFVGCHDGETGDNMPGSHDPYISPSVPKGSISVLASETQMRLVPGLGYDIMGDYLSNNSIREAVVDLDKVDKDRITYIQATASEGAGYEGHNMVELLQSIMKRDFAVPPENRNDLLFTGTFTDNKGLDSHYDYSSQYTFVLGHSGSTGYLYRLLALNMKWESCLSDEFKEALALYTPKEIIEKFGTHILKDIHLGSLIRTLYRTVVADSRQECLRTAITGQGARQSTIYKFPHITITYPEEVVKKNYDGTITVAFQGGNPKTLPTISLTPNEVIGNPINPGSWMLSSNETNVALTRLEGNDLIPLYDVVADPIKKQQLKEAITAHIKAHQLPMLQTAPIFQAGDGKNHRYFTSYDELTRQTQPPYTCHGVIGSVFVVQTAGTVPLYQFTDGKNDRLSLSPTLIDRQPMGSPYIMGYVYEKYQPDLDRIYEISDGTNFAYTLENKSTYGERGSWKQTGNFFYTKKISL